VDLVLVFLLIWDRWEGKLVSYRGYAFTCGSNEELAKKERQVN